MNRIAIFAHFDANNIIQDYVLFYLCELKKVCSCIVFVSDSNLSKSQLKKVENITAIRINGRHYEYDFGSYKRGFTYCIQNDMLRNIDELVFCNDSCFGPIGSNGFNGLFNAMQNKTCDFWGIAINNFGLKKQGQEYIYVQNIPHVQSYFFVCKSLVFNSTWFSKFITSITKEIDKKEIIIKYEQRLTYLVNKNSCSVCSYLNFEKNKRDLAKNWQETIKTNGLLIKKSQFKDIILHLHEIKKYPTSLIVKFAKNELGLFTYYKIKFYNIKIQLFKFAKTLITNNT